MTPGGGGRSGRETERRLVVELIDRNRIAPTLEGEGAAYMTMGGGPAEYRRGGWKVVSHTFELFEDGSALFTYLLER